MKIVYSRNWETNVVSHIGSTHLSFSLSFFVHGESIVCASVDVRQHPPVRQLTRRHLLLAQQTNQGIPGTVLWPASHSQGQPHCFVLHLPVINTLVCSWNGSTDYKRPNKNFVLFWNQDDEGRIFEILEQHWHSFWAVDGPHWSTLTFNFILGLFQFAWINPRYLIRLTYQSVSFSVFRLFC